MVPIFSQFIVCITTQHHQQKFKLKKNEFVIPMEVDTGASASLLIWKVSNFIVRFISNKMQVANICWGNCFAQRSSGSWVFLQRKNVQLNFLITNEKYPNVLGRDVLGALLLNWNKLFLFGVSMISDCKTDFHFRFHFPFPLILLQNQNSIELDLHLMH